MTGKEKIKQMVDSGEFAERMIMVGVCPGALMLQDYCTTQDGVKNVDDAKRCQSCWCKALESEVE